MAFEKAIQSLAQIEEKLRRAFNLAGPIGASLKPEVSAILIAGDLRDPGHAAHSGRSWAWVFGQQGVPVGVNYVSLVFDADVLVEALHAEISTVALLEAFTLVATEAPAIAVVQQAGMWRDRRTSTTDVPPMRSNAAWGALTGADIAEDNRVGRWTSIGVGPERATSIMIPAGGSLNWRCDLAQTRHVIAARGRIWP